MSTYFLDYQHAGQFNYEGSLRHVFEAESDEVALQEVPRQFAELVDKIVTEQKNTDPNFDASCILIETFGKILDWKPEDSS